MVKPCGNSKSVLVVAKKTTKGEVWLLILTINCAILMPPYSKCGLAHFLERNIKTHDLTICVSICAAFISALPHVTVFTNNAMGTTFSPNANSS